MCVCVCVYISRVIAIILSHRQVHRSFEYFLVSLCLSISLFLSFSPRVSCFSNDLTRPAVSRTIDSRSLDGGTLVSYKYSCPHLQSRGELLLRECVRSRCDDGEPLLALASLAPDYRVFSHPRVLLYLFPLPLLLRLLPRFLRLASRDFLSRRVRGFSISRFRPAILRHCYPPTKLNNRVFAYSAIMISIPDRYYDVTISGQHITTFPDANVARQRERESGSTRGSGRFFAIARIVRILLPNDEYFDLFYNFGIVHTLGSLLSVLCPCRYFFLCLYNSQNLDILRS